MARAARSSTTATTWSPGFKSLAEGPEWVYLLELSLDNVKPDVTFHRLKVKVNRDGLQAQARRGYFMSLPENAKH